MAWNLLKNKCNVQNVRKRKNQTNLHATIIYDNSDENEEPTTSTLEITPAKKRKQYNSLNITNIIQNMSKEEINNIPDNLIDLCSGLPEDFNIENSSVLNTTRSKPLQLSYSHRTQEAIKNNSLKIENLVHSQENWIKLKKSFDLNHHKFGSHERQFYTDTNSNNIIIEDRSSTSDENSDPITNPFEIEEINSSQQTPNPESQDLCFSSQLSLRYAINSMPSSSSDHSNSTVKNINFCSKKNIQSEFIEDGNTELDLFIIEIQKDLLNDKKIRPKKGGLVERLHKILKSNQSDVNFWKNEIENGLIQKINLCSIENIEKSYNNYIITGKVNNKNDVKFFINIESKIKHLFNIGYKFKVSFDFAPYEIDNHLFFVAVSKIT